MASTTWIGVLTALVGGGLASWLFIAITSKLIGLREKPNKDSPRISGWVTGFVERSFFLILIVLGVSGVPESMMGWLALKLASNWHRYDPDKLPSARTRSLLALIAGLISLAFAYIGGAIICGKFAVGT